jgi:hypothetical protein
MDLLLDLVGVAAFVLVAGGLAWVRSQRTRRILGSAVPTLPRAPLPPAADGPDIARRLFARVGVEGRPRAGALRGVDDFDEPALLEGLRGDFAGLLGPASEAAPRTGTPGAALDAVRRTPCVVVAAREPTLDRVFVDERWIAANVSLEAVVREAGATATGPLRRVVERWALRRPRTGGAWELVQVLDADVRALEAPDGNPPRYAPVPAGEPVPLDLLAPMLAAGMALLRAEAPPPDAPVLPGFVAELGYRVAVGESGGDAGVATLTDARGAPVARHGAIEVWAVFVTGTVGADRFRERWILVRPPGGEWRMWRAEER